MKKLIASAVLMLVTACAQTGQPQGHTEGMACKCCQEMMKDGSECCCKGRTPGSGMNMQEGKGMMCKKRMQEKAETEKPATKPKTAPTSSGHEQHH